ncbi:hypothetical protein PR003_g4599 [Phytophthora rubi]|nr:hypothetical protein PR002_g4618 [Phytophthora rubi]KAE9352017.1 hypothetical protein PR003_g4599 [Phytophthora rubi]
MLLVIKFYVIVYVIVACLATVATGFLLVIKACEMLRAVWRPLPSSCYS